MCAICLSHEEIAGQLGKISVCQKCYNLYAVRGNEKMMCVALDAAIEGDERLIAARKQIERLERDAALLQEFLERGDLADEAREWLRNRASR